MKLYEKLPESVTVSGKRYKCNFDFRNVLKMLEVMQRKDLLPDARDYIAAKCVVRGRLPGKSASDVYDELCNVLFPKPPKRAENGQKPHERIMSFEEDAGLIRTAFRQVYNIDLFTAKLHWLAFSELLQNLPEGNRFEDVVSIRARPIPPPTKYNTESRLWLINAKRSVALETAEEETKQRVALGIRYAFSKLLSIAKKDGDDVGK